jgi:signal transduction histidine kinase
MTFKSKVIAGIGTALLIFISIGLLSYQRLLRARDDVFWVTHTHIVLETLETVQASVISAETNQRGFLLTDDETYLSAYNDSLAKARLGLRDVRQLTVDNPIQQKSLDAIEPLVKQRFGLLADVVQTRQKGGLDAAVDSIKSGAGKRAMNQLDGAISAMEDREHTLLAQRTKTADASTAQARHVIVVGYTLSFFFLFLAGAMIFQEMERRRVAEEEIRGLNANLEVRVTERTAELAFSNSELHARTADLARSNNELQQFAYVASHDLQEPLRMVASFTQLLAKRYNDKLDDDAREFIHYAVDGATRLQTLIGDLLTYSRVGTQAKALKPTNCDAALDRVLASLKLAIQDSGTTIVRDPLPTVLADEVQLCQLFQNLLTNAMKFHSDRPPRIHIFAEQHDDTWHISVRDNGIGIAPEHTERIWIIFQRLHTKQEYPGTGIGLAICKKIAERHGGHISVQPSPGGGSTFTFTIPIYEYEFARKEKTDDEQLRATVSTD